MSDKQWRTKVALDDEPEIALAIARLITMFSVTDVHLPFLLSDLIHVEPAVCERLLSANTSTRNRVSAVEMASRSVPLTKARADFYDEVISEIKFLQKRRDFYAHAMFTTTETPGTLRANGYRFDERKTSEEIVTTDKINKECARAERLHLSIWQLMKGQGYSLEALREKRA